MSRENGPRRAESTDDIRAAIIRLIETLEHDEGFELDPKRRQEAIGAAVQAVSEEARRITVEFESRLELGPLRWMLRFRSSGLAPVVVAMLGLACLALIGGVIGYFLRSR